MPAVLTVLAVLFKIDAGNVLQRLLMRSPVMERALGRISDEEKEASGNALPEEQADF